MRRILVGFGLAAVLSVSACGGESDGPGSGSGGSSAGGTSSGGASTGGAATGGVANTDPDTMTSQELAVAYCEEERAQAVAGGCESSLDGIELCERTYSDDGPFESSGCNAAYRARLVCRLTRGSLQCGAEGPEWLGCEAETQALDPCWI
jgi:hypothetical protein